MSFIKGEAVIDGGTATTSPVRVYIKGSNGKETFAKRIVFTNEDATNNLLVSLNGTTFMSLKPGTSREVTGAVNQFYVKSSAVTVPWTAVITAAA